MHKLLIIDGNSLLFRAYYATAYPGKTLMQTKDGVVTNAVFAFANMMTKIISGLAGDEHMLVAFDTGKKTFRHKELEAYKANRKPVPLDLVSQMPIAREFLKSLGVFTFEMDGFEGDDVAGTAAAVGAATGYQVSLYTSDRDFLQLIGKNVEVNLLKKGLSDIQIMDEAALFAEWGLKPAQIVDYKGLCGDVSDNIPGVPGIGDVTAVKLIQQYGSLEAIIAAADEIGGKLGEKIKANQEIARLSRHLAEIRTDIDLPFKLEATFYEGYDFEKLNAFCQKYELRSVLNKINPRFKKEAKSQEVLNPVIVSSTANFTFGHELGIALDMEDTNYHRAGVFGMALYNGHDLVYIALEDLKKDEKLLAALSDASIEKYCFDYKAMKCALHLHGVAIEGLAFDVLLAAYLLDSSLNNAPSSIFGFFGVDISVPGTDTLSLLPQGNVDQTSLIAYQSLRIAAKATAELEKIESLNLYREVELPLAGVLAKMELEGFPLDRKTLVEIGSNFKVKLDALTQEIYELAGESFNIASPKKVGEILFDKLGLAGNKKYSTSVDVLKSLVDKHPIVGKILEHRKYAKLLSTYIEGLVTQIYPDGKLHAIFNQALTTTGRLSSSEPNLQNISIRDEEGKLIRKAFFYKEPELNIMSFDYSQIELRVLASLSNCHNLIDVFNHDEDIHTGTARRVFHIEGEVSQAQRRKAKTVNFGIVYGISDWGLADQLEISPFEAKEIISAFYATFPEVRTYFSQIVTEAEKNGYVSTLLGRRRYLRELHDANYQVREFAKRAAMNAPIQGTAADLIKVAMVKIDRALTEGKFKTRLVLQIHDELLFKVPDDEVEKVFPMIEDLMENALQLKVKLIAEGSYAKNWHEAK